ncbi:hypothetical protein NHF48_002330 [Sphingomonas sp. H160509]|uniref:hypothetical protein n=1 Tax=Sphingomonas sp. H160509 TaxID=2955313 RepID=UPI002098209A|nr:hypothetical protein [Sphingomonas sp. H160509]MDD1450053.1 hypothetical protein [Sphingomonas sp. H160509]
MPIGAGKRGKIEVGDGSAAERCRSGFLCLLFRNEAVSTGSCLKPFGFAFLLAVKTGKIMTLLMTAGVNNPLFHGWDDGCSWFMRNGNESG